MKRTKEEADLTRQTLMKAALVVFSKHGYAATRLEDIAQEANVTRGAIYHHFGGKAELFNALVSEFSTGAVDVTTQLMASSQSYVDALRQMLLTTWDYLESNADYRAVMELTMFKTGVDEELAEGMRLKKEGTRLMMEQLAQFIAEGMAKGELRADLDPLETARTFIAAQNGLALLWLFDPEAFSLRASAHAAAEIFVRGVIP
ncbi:MAG: TetR family transcriptional regulator [Anaerolineae bacterium]